MAQAKTPIFLVIRSAIRNPIRVFGRGEKMFLQLRERKLGVDRSAVAHDVEVALFEVDDFFAAGVLNIGIADVPFFGYRPVEHFGSAGNLMDLELDQAAQHAQCFAYAAAGDAPAKRIEVGHKAVKRLPDGLRSAAPFRRQGGAPLPVPFRGCAYHQSTTRTSGTGTINLPPRLRYSACCARISSTKFHASNRTKSGWSRSS